MGYLTNDGTRLNLHGKKLLNQLTVKCSDRHGCKCHAMFRFRNATFAHISEADRTVRFPWDVDCNTIPKDQRPLFTEDVARVRAHCKNAHPHVDLRKHPLLKKLAKNQTKKIPR